MIDVLIADHRSTERLFQQYEAAPAPGDVGALVRQIILELIQHAEAEEQYVYPAARRVIANGDRVIEHDIGEHSRVEVLLDALDGRSSDDPDFDGLVRQVIAEVRQHVSEEESITLPQLRNVIPESDLIELAGKVALAKKVSPTRPHPASPDHPPFNKILGSGAGLVDRVRDWLRSDNS
ncbi:MAG: hemerythrin domain-containing protein [Mycobacterium leprae]